MRRVRDVSQRLNRVKRDDIKDCIKNVLGTRFAEPSSPLVLDGVMPSVSDINFSDITDTQSATPSALSLSAWLSISAPLSAVKYAPIYNGNGNTGGAVPSAIYYADGETVYIQNNVGSLVKTGKTFSCWNTAADGSGTDYNPFYGLTNSLSAGTLSGTTPNTGSFAKMINGSVSDYNLFTSALPTLIACDYGSGVTKVINEVRWYDTTWGFTYSFNLEYSDNGTDWTSVGTNTKTNVGAVYQYFYYNDSTSAHRYWRIKVTSSSSGNNINFNELMFLEATGAANSTYEMTTAGLTLYAKWV